MGRTSAQRLPRGTPAGPGRGLRVLRPPLALPRAPSWKASWKSRIAASPAQQATPEIMTEEHSKQSACRKHSADQACDHGLQGQASK